MGYQFESGMMYRMPTHFGPSLGPRQGLANRRYVGRDQEVVTYSVSFLTHAAQLERLLPPGFDLDREPVVTVKAKYATGIEWLAGRGYNMLSVEFPVQFVGTEDRARGPFITVMFENMADPIITGRDDLGYSKLYCELPSPSVTDDGVRCSAEWSGFEFAELIVRDLTEATPQPTDSASDGQLHFKYIPRTGVWGEADVAYPVLIPNAALTDGVDVVERRMGSGEIVFHRGRWEELPTLCTIVDAFADLEVREYRGAAMTRSVGTPPAFYRRGDVSPARILK